MIDACNTNNIPVNEVDFTVEDVHRADEAFVTGTFAGIIPVISVDNNLLSSGKRGILTQKLQLLYQDLISREYSDN